MRVIKTIEGVHVLASPQVAVPGRRLGNSARYGVGEIITLMLNGNPPQGRSMLYWNVKSGGGAITNLLVPGKCEYTAPDIGLEQLARGERSFEVRLQLVDAKGVLGEVALEIVSPQNAWLIKLGEKHQQGSANSGFWGQPCLGPNDVSFMRTLLKETRGTINTTGSVFEAARGRIHADTLGWVPASKVVDQGTLFNAPDSVLSYRFHSNLNRRSTVSKHRKLE
jgi:hypothetical protein